ncbi:NAD(P)-binding domain-containing protein [Stenotrophomonas sp. VV52]|uniref:NAD(P)-binding domain-containing protein n=1 Tax=Stenotrophomonas sp. VV52 TaxID=2066958 RepID=UPI000C9DB044|nr:NAD(P)-binding domain-containing protein [Stenotrophomonas sp. VV52]
MLQHTRWAPDEAFNVADDDGAVPWEVVVIGAGQSGLAVSATLVRAGVRHLVLEAETVGCAWRRRWDSFQTNTPNATTALPGYVYTGNDPEGFATGDEVVALLGRYAGEQALPVIEQCPVRRVTHDAGGYRIETRKGPLRARAVVVATGEYRRPQLPRVPFVPCRGLSVLHSGDYRHAGQLPEGGVLVVGGGQSGAQIAQDLRAAGRNVYWSIASRAMNLRRLRGRDSLDWWIQSGLIHRHVSQHPAVLAGVPGALRSARNAEFPLVSGKGEQGKGSSISLLSMHRQGVVLLGRLQSLQGQVARFNDVRPQVRDAIAATRVEYQRLHAVADAHFAGAVEARTDDARYLPEEVYLDWEPEHARDVLDLEAEGIRSVLLATGFAPDWSWLELDNVFDTRGYPLGEYGVSSQQGLFFVGLYNLQRVSSSYLCNGGRDAEALLPHIQAHLASHRAGHAWRVTTREPST